MDCMPKQETFFEETTGDLKIEVIKTYDHAFAREAFERMDEIAQAHLWHSLGIDNLYDTTEIPPANEPSRQDFLWSEVEDSAREDGNLSSFFVVNEIRGNIVENIYVSPDWPSAEAFAKTRMTAVH